MGTLNAIYVRTTGADSLKAIKKKYRKLVTEEGLGFVWIQRLDKEVECPEKELAAWAKQLGTDVLWLSFQSVSDSFQFHHWHAGEHLRSLEYQINQEGWERAEGTPEPWEPAAFEDIEPEAGSHEPFIDARETARAVGEHYQLPGWLPQRKPTSKKGPPKKK